MDRDEPKSYSGSEIAVIGMAGRFPRANNIDELWRNLDQAVECITFFERAELEAAGISSAVFENPLYVGAGGVVDNIDLFDAAFFGFSPREAEITDPQQRLFLECAWEALENAGYDPDTYAGAIGVYAGAGMSAYLINVYTNPRAMQTIGQFRVMLGNDKDYLPTWASYKLNLRGPSVNANTACSTSLVTAHLACQSLLNGECDIALAGGSRIRPEHGYLYQQGGILSPDGHCRAFDARAGGTVGGNGVALVVLKRLADALADGDTIHAVILGSAINNDGSQKAGFTAPSVDGQTKVIAEALSVAGVDAETITYVETHGTGTELGDPIEIEALTHAFRAQTDRRSFCAVGTVKSNVGHLDTVAGVTGLIKTVLALEHRRIPASLHFEAPNPAIDFAGSPFYVNAQSRDWEIDGVPRRAGVSAFGIGGTNAHMVLEEAPECEPSSPSREWQLLALSARTATALDRMTENLIGHLEQRPEMSLTEFSDLAYTLQVGRKAFPHRRILVASGHQDALTALREMDPNRVLTYSHEVRHRPVVFMFPGGGAQYAGMGADLYRSEPVFRREIDACARLLDQHASFDLRELLYSKSNEQAEPLLRRTSYALPALFAVEYATARLWMEWGIRPQAMIGHSLGEYAAACIAGSIRLEDALAIVALRGRLFEELPSGAMLAVSLTEDAAASYLDDRISIAAINTSSHCVFSGETEAIDALAERLNRDGIEANRLHIDVAAHCAMVEPLLERFRAFVETIPLSAPAIPFLSNVTGTWITAANAMDPGYWVRHLRQTVRFADGLGELFADSDRVFLEVGPGRTLSLLAARHAKKDARHLLLSSLRHPQDRGSDVSWLTSALGRLWLSGVRPDWEAFYAGERRHRVPLPTYPFERQRYWIEAARAAGASAEMPAAEMELEASEPVPVEESSLSLHMRPVLQSAYVAPRTESEAQVAKIWQALLGVEPIGIHDNFFELGGHSLLLVQLVAKLRDELVVQIPMRSLAGAPTVAELALLIQESRSEQLDLPADVLPVLVPDPESRYRPFPLTEVQEAYWIGRSAGLELGNTATQIYTEFDSGQLDVERFQQAWRRLIERHDMLRAIFLPDGRQQVLESTPPYEISVEDLRDMPREAGLERLAAMRRQMIDQIRPSDRWPLFDVRASLLEGGRVRIHTTMDYLLVDGWSIELLRADLARFYDDPDLELPPFETSFRDYVVAEVAFRGTEAYQRSLDYWIRRLPTLPSGPELPLAKNPAALAKPRFVRRQASLEADAWSALKSRAARAGLTPSGVLMAVYAEVLAAWSKTSRFLVNLTLFNRYPIHPQVDDLLGDFTSLVLLEVNAALPGTFEERAQRVQRQLWEDLDHRYVSGVRVLRELMRVRGGGLESIAPVVFTSAVSVQRAHSVSAPASRRGDGLSGQSVYGVGATPQVWIDHGAGEDSNGALGFAWDAVDELFPAGMLQQMFNAYVTLLERLASGEEAWQERPRLLPAAQRELLAGVNATEAPRPEGLLHAPFAAWAVADPSRTAVVAGERTLTYGELFDLANRLGHRLRDGGASVNRLVAVVMEKGWEQVAAVLGVLQAGAAYLPVDPELPAERLAYLLTHGEVKIALTQSHWDAKLVWPTGVERISVDGNALSGFPSEPPTPVARPDDLAYVIFTSGSTGQPKGVMIEHSAALNTVVDMNRRFGVEPADRVLALSALNFDLSVYDIFGILAAGGAVVIPDAKATREPAHWADLVARHDVTIWNSVPALMKMLVDADPGAPISGLRLVLLSGDWIPVQLPNQILALAPAAKVISLGGATEASIWSILYPIDKVDPEWTSIPYGLPMSNQTFHVLDELLDPCPIWVPGQLFIGGTGLARGYWRDEAKTSTSFIIHPETGERLYRTGDLGRYLPDGTIEFLGREDFQVKVQGFRIELGEIEVALTAHPGVADAVVVARGEKRGEKRLVAYVVPHAQRRTSSGGASRREENGAVAFPQPSGGDGALWVPGLRYSPEPISAEHVGNVLESLGQIGFNGGPKFRYPSPTGTYPVRAYVYVKPERVVGLAGGFYQYEPSVHRLVPLQPAADLESPTAFGPEAGLFEQAAFAIMLGADAASGQNAARDLCLIEAGAMSQLLLLSADKTDDLGLLPVEELEPELLPRAFGVAEGHEFFLGLFGGRLAPELPHPPDVASRPGAAQRAHVLEDSEGLADDLRLHLEKRLPRYMVPAAFIFVDALPLSANGKVDRQALPEPEGRAGGERQLVAPRTPLEHRLMAMWRDILGLGELGVYDSFFEAGGHSLLAARLIARVRETLRVSLSLASIFESPTVEGMASAIERQLAAGDLGSGLVTELPPIVPAPEAWHEPFPLTDLQQAYWVGRTGAFELNVTPQMYVERPIPTVNIARLQLALQRLIERHHMLRAIVLSDGRQRILERVPPYSIQVIDLRGLEPVMRESALYALRPSLAQEPIAIDRWPLLDVRVSRLDEQHDILHVSLSLMICDAWSNSIFSHELQALYWDPEAALPPLDLSYRDYVLALQGLEMSAIYQQALGYWRDRLTDLPPAPELPLAKNPAAIARPRFVRRSGTLDLVSWWRFKKRARQAGVTPDAAICAAYSSVVAAWSKQQHFLINVLYFNRLHMHPQVNSLLGNFSATILLEVDFTSAENFTARARSIQEQLWRDLENSFVSGVRVLRELHRSQGTGARAAAPVVFASGVGLAQRDESDLAEPPVTPAIPPPPPMKGALQTPQVWLDHQVFEDSDRLVFNWDALEELFPPGLVQEMFDAYSGLLAQLAAEEDGAWQEAALELVPAGQLEQRARVNATEAPVSDALLQDLAAAQMQARPAAPAIIGSSRRLTYGELDCRAAHLGRRLRDLGAQPNELVAIVLEKGWEQAVAVLGVLRSGAAYLPIDPGLPTERFRYLLEKGEAKLVVTRSTLDDRLDWPAGVRRLRVDEDETEPVRTESSVPAQGADDLAYVIFTSGSTGLPKGVMIDHRGAVNTVLDINERFGVGPEDRVLALSSLAFDLSVYDVFGLLAAGGAVVVPDSADLREPSRWVEWIERERITVWNSVPALAQMLVDHLAERSERLPSCLRLVMLSGDWVPVTLPDRLRALGEVEVVSLGGATEASIWSILYPVKEVDPAWPSIPYGRPMRNQKLHVLNEALEPCPVWVPGHLYIAGTGLARGYWRDEDRTAASFFRHPRTKERLYRTGDLGRYLPDGDIEFLGREDLQVKVQGYRIELGEIEAALARHPGVRSSAVIAVGEKHGPKSLVAYGVPEPQELVTVDDLRIFLQATLPEYMVPHSLVLLPDLPLTGNGKVDRGALAALSTAPSGDAAAAVPPRDDLELELTSLWEQLLAVGPIGIRDNFFDLGGHSLLAVRLMAQIERRFGRNLPLSILFEGATVEHLAAVLRQEIGPLRRRPLVRIQPGGDRPPFFCVHPVGGSVLCYLDLARRLGPEQPFYGLQVPDREDERRQDSIESMAEAYVDAMRAVQPSGPYHIGGWSMGGVIAFEMARQLRTAGEAVALLALVDATAQEGTPDEELDDAAMLATFADDLARLSGKRLSIQLDELRGLPFEEALSRVFEQIAASGALPPEVGCDETRRFFEVYRTNLSALFWYRPGSYEGNVLLFRATEENAGKAMDPALGWNRVITGRLTNESIPGDHYTIMQEPLVGTVAEHLRSHFEAASGPGGQPTESLTNQRESR